jgi:stage II sporulation protein D
MLCKKTKYFTFLVLLLGLQGRGILYAQYNNPILKVLLFSTSAQVILIDKKGMTYQGNDERVHYQKKLVVSRRNSEELDLNRKWRHRGSLMVQGNSILEVYDGRKRVRRRYEGKIVVKPYSNGLYVINHIPIESYLEGVLNAEISTQWNLEAVKAQSIIARTFALYKRSERFEKPWHVTSGHGDQIYQGVNVSDQRGTQAIEATSGIVVTHKGFLAQTFYHSNCGGSTEDPGYLWNYSYPYLSIKEVPYGTEDPKYYWNKKISEKELLSIIKKTGTEIGSIKNIYISEKTQSNRVYKLFFVGSKDSASMLAADFRKYAGYGEFQSLLFDVIKVPGGFQFKGKGNGHGVGMCQWAAKEMADNGFTFDEILYFFYDDINLQFYSQG